MDTRTAFKEFILEFIPISYSLSPKHSTDLRRFAAVLQLVFKKKFVMELPKGHPIKAFSECLKATL